VTVSVILLWMKLIISTPSFKRNLSFFSSKCMYYREISDCVTIKCAVGLVVGSALKVYCVANAGDTHYRCSVRLLQVM